MSEAVRGVDVSKWEAAMQEEYESLMGREALESWQPFLRITRV